MINSPRPKFDLEDKNNEKCHPRALFATEAIGVTVTIMQSLASDAKRSWSGQITAWTTCRRKPNALGRIQDQVTDLVLLRRFAAVSPFCFGNPAQPDIASWRIRILHISIDRRSSSPLDATRHGRYPRSLEAFFFTPVDFFRFPGTMHGLHSNEQKT